ncbi:decarboxylating NADP(+)-dependent phosphogluconate dehydrogenase [Pontibacter sp. HSC-36F09]|uniref:decarboxylating NADP(+)-dependent phosphogluconate dehydrogenase n=1 Tax=Pontibacter sp. HSC-36F09 TaxID=2910966 RepID=UPI0020A0309F|nr:decarboxylating NADP(+)-dependent phosphogluconate dehydrogenase [Pontibacter sp. HSC-36F09]MCP2044599.1 6-phosphogluconate dehydrogenase [Pontibacter sp. HSC-36F09]
MIYIVMGVTGSGKTTVGQKLAGRLQLPFYDADDYHPLQSIDKMRQGIPLNDQDRAPWLAQLAGLIPFWETNGGAVLACSALKEDYRKRLQTVPDISWIYLDGSRDTILKRLQTRHAHFMPPAMLESQLQALEKPAYGIHVDVSLSPEQIVQEVMTKLEHMNPQSEFGVIGLGVMGKSLALNLASHGVRVAVYNRHLPGKEEGIAEQVISENPSFTSIKGFDQLEEFVQSLEKPRKVLLMIFAGAIDAQLEALIPLLEPGDVVIDGGNSYYKDTTRRTALLSGKGLHFVGTGISGGEEGARKGPSIMPGGPREGFEQIAKYLELIAARDSKGKSCTTYIGPDGAGHFVKMVHNGIEYAEMQALTEVYSLLRYMLGIAPADIAAIFSDWQKNGLGSYLLEITIDILQKKEGEELLLDKILDQAEQKGTGGWSAAVALEYGVPYDTLSAAVMARALSAIKTERVKAADLYQKQNPNVTIDENSFVHSLKQAYQVTRIINHEIGFSLMREVSVQLDWNLNLSEIARIWTNGCIIRSELMEELVEIYQQEQRLLMAPPIVDRIRNARQGFASVVALGLQYGIPLPVLSAALNYFLGYSTADSAANLIQAQRDYFGAHTYQRKDKPTGEYFHTNWKG